MSIQFIDVSKTYRRNGKTTQALKDIYLTIPTGKIFGLIGYSGAGKSTLLRTINLLERPTSGQVIINDVDMTRLTKQQLQKQRLNIGMIFQQFNLIQSKTVAENIAFSLKAANFPKAQYDTRIAELLELVGLSHRKDSYPRELSGGQKQRVGIARALANNPEILLCDEATSALDPETTKSILNLIKDINQKLGITVVVITHEMDVIKEICDEVAVMDGGVIVEHADVFTVFSNPQSDLTRHFVNDIYHLELPEQYKQSNVDSKEIITIKFIGDSAESAFINNLYKKFNCDISIIQGRIEYIQNQPIGILTFEVSGSAEERLAINTYISKSTGIERVA
ncbi:ATP-binding cassette domain-containing protein [Macrococcus capreoli]